MPVSEERAPNLRCPDPGWSILHPPILDDRFPKDPLASCVPEVIDGSSDLSSPIYRYANPEGPRRPAEVAPKPFGTATRSEAAPPGRSNGPPSRVTPSDLSPRRAPGPRPHGPAQREGPRHPRGAGRPGAEVRGAARAGEAEPREAGRDKSSASAPKDRAMSSRELLVQEEKLGAKLRGEWGNPSGAGATFGGGSTEPEGAERRATRRERRGCRREGTRLRSNEVRRESPIVPGRPPFHHLPPPLN